MSASRNVHATRVVGWALRYLGQTVILATAVAVVAGLVAGYLSGEPFIVACVAALAWLVTAAFWLSEADPPEEDPS